MKTPSGGARMDRVATGLSKVPEVTFDFWIIKIAATTLGETGGDAVTMSMNLGYLVRHAAFSRPVRGYGRRADIWRRNFTHGCIGRRSSPRRRSARQWLILPTALWASAMLAGYDLAFRLPDAGAIRLVLVSRHGVG